MWCGSIWFGAVVLSGTTVHNCCLPLIGGESTTTGLRFTISGGRKPWLKSTRTIVPGAGWLTTVMRYRYHRNQLMKRWFVKYTIAQKYPLGAMNYLVGGEAPPGKVGLDPPCALAPVSPKGAPGCRASGRFPREWEKGLPWGYPPPGPFPRSCPAPCGAGNQFGYPWRTPCQRRGSTGDRFSGKGLAGGFATVTMGVLKHLGLLPRSRGQGATSGPCAFTACPCGKAPNPCYRSMEDDPCVPLI